MFASFLWIVWSVSFTVLAASLAPQIPSIASFSPSNGTFELSPTVQIVVDSRYAHQGKPSLLEFAQTFQADLRDVVSYVGDTPLWLSSIAPEDTHGIPTIYITLDPTLEHELYNGEPTDEGYDFDIGPSLYIIKASAPVGVWWGTRTLLQQAALQLATGEKTVKFPTGAGTDSPGWEVRGFMLDAGRHWFDTSFLGDLCIYASFFKLNELHLHASDNLWNPAFLYGTGNEGWKNLYAAFRFQPSASSPVGGIVPSIRKNETWTKDAFLTMQDSCARHGVAVIPEIDTPGHSLVITQWKPELMEAGAPDHLNLSHPDTIPTIKAIWDEFLPWFAAGEVSIGADEYDAALADDYIDFVNEMSAYIFQESGGKKDIRIWGTYEPSTTRTISTSITIQHWDLQGGDSVPVELLAAGYRIINSEQAFLYLDGKTSDDGQFPQMLNEPLLWAGAPGGGGWAPNIFSASAAANNTRADAPGLRGALFALWSDWGNNASTALEAYYQLARSAAIFAEKTWTGSGVRPATELVPEQFEAVYPALNAAAPGQNLNRVVAPVHGNVVFEHEGAVPPQGIRTGIPSVGPPYTLSFVVRPEAESEPGEILFAGEDSVLHADGLTFEATGQLYTLSEAILPMRQDTNVSIRATRAYTYAVINGEEEQPRFWYTLMDIWGEYMALGNMSFAAPIAQIGGRGFNGTIRDVRLTLGV